MLLKWNEWGQAMVVKFRVQLPPILRAGKDRRQYLLRALSHWSTTGSLGALVFALWRLGADLQWTGEFAFSEGLLSHWQVWFAMAVVFQLFSVKLDRYGRGDSAAMP